MNLGESCQTVFFTLPNQSIVYDVLQAFHTMYRPIHTYLSIVICIVATICNVCNIVILTRKPMRTPVNMILTAMACCDMVVLFSNLIFTTHWNFVAFVHCYPRHWSYGWALFLIAHAHLSLVGHSSSVWLSVMLALIRYLTLRSRGTAGGSGQVGLSHSYVAIGIVIVLVSTMNAPNFLTYKIIEMPLGAACVIADPNVTDPLSPAYIPGVSDIALKAHCLVFRMAFWMSGTVFKVLPCLLLTVLVGLLVRILAEVKRNRERLMKPSISSAHNGGAPLPTRGSQRNLRTTDSTDRTTRMLLAIVCVFLVTELPQGVMAVMSGLFSEDFRTQIYNHVGDILDLLSLINACTTFVIYCTMSAQFRQEFRRVFLPRTISDRFPRVDRHGSEGFTKMSFLRPPADVNFNFSDHSSATMTVAGSMNSVRRSVPPSRNRSPAAWSRTLRTPNDPNDHDDTPTETTELLTVASNSNGVHHYQPPSPTYSDTVDRSFIVESKHRFLSPQVEARYHRV